MPSVRPIVLALLLAPAAVAPARAAALPDGFADRMVVDRLDSPSAFAFLPDGRVLFTEQYSGRVRMVVNDAIAATDPVLVVPALNNLGEERGLLGVAVDPAWPERPYVYLFHSRLGLASRLVRYTAGGDLTDGSGGHLTLTEPLLLLDDIPDSSYVHNGGGLRFGLDRRLLLTLGDDQRACQAQDPSRLRGVVLRLDVSGLPPGGGGPVPRALLVPPDNPMAAGPDSNAALVLAHGLRNPWRVHVDVATGAIFVPDPGDGRFEEIDVIAPGANYGWPFREGPLVRVPAGCVEPGGSGAAVFASAIVNWARPAQLIAVTGGPVYRPVSGAPFSWPATYDGDLLWAEYYTGALRRLRFEAGAWVAPAPEPGQPNTSDWATGLVSIADLQVGPDGALWHLAHNDATFAPASGSLRRILYVGDVVGVPPAAPAALALTAHPNPFSARIELSFRAVGDGPARLTVLDLAGRRVRALPVVATAGPQRIEWDGRDDRGSPVPSGLYVARLEAGGRVETIRLVRGR